MIIYLICFFISIVLLKISDKSKNNIEKNIIAFIALLIPCLLAGLRMTTIGTDVEWYAEPLFKCAKISKNFEEYYSMKFLNQSNLQYFFVKNYEIGFSILVYILTKITENLQVILFFIQTLIIYPIYFALRKYKILENKIWISMGIFYFMFFNMTLNIMRQFIAIALVFYGISCLINDKNKLKTIIFIAFGCFFHKSALLGIIIYLVYEILNYQFSISKTIKISRVKINISKVLALMIVLVGFILVINSNYIVNLLNNIGFEEYTSYINGEIHFLYTKIIKIMPIIFIFIVVYKNFMRQYKDSWFYIVMFIVDSIIISQFSSVMSQAGRIGYIFQIFNIVSFPILCTCGLKKKTNRTIIIIMLLYVLLYWYYSYVIGNAGETVPYEFFWNKL